VALVDEVSRELEQRIFRGLYGVHEKLPSERALAASLRVNRNVVREALRRLEQTGLVETQQGSGTRVRDFAAQGGIEILRRFIAAPPAEMPRDLALALLEFRVFYGVGLVELAARRASAEAVWELRARLMRLKAAATEEAWGLAERDFIDGFVSASENLVFRFLQNTFAEMLKGRSGFVAILMEHRQRVERAYGAILDAIAAHAPMRAAATMRRLMEDERAWIAAN
jgi:GntR family transcriptional repressor for pyruvate dehydrogenase complex